MTEHTHTLPAGCFKDLPFIEHILAGTAPPVSELALPIFAVHTARDATADTLSGLVEYFQAASKTNPIALATFVTAVLSHTDKEHFFAHNREFMVAVTALAKYF